MLPQIFPRRRPAAEPDTSPPPERQGSLRPTWQTGAALFVGANLLGLAGVAFWPHDAVRVAPSTHKYRLSVWPNQTTAGAPRPFGSVDRFVGPGRNQQVEGFVRTQGSQFRLGGRPYYFAGTNDFAAALLDLRTPAQIRAGMRVHADAGAQVLRVFAFSNGRGGGSLPIPRPIQPRPGKFDEIALRRLDLVIAEGAHVGLRFILPLANFEPELGGMQWYVDRLLGRGRAKELFYTHPRVRRAYRNYVAMLIGRTNSVTGLRYGDDPAILAWELANEPHTGDLVERHRKLPPGEWVRLWAQEMSGFIRRQKIAQLISSGEEGYRAEGDTSCCTNNWFNGGFKGTNFVGNLRLPDIDFATVHIYPDNWEIAAKKYTWVIKNVIGNRAAIAHSLGKPIVMEEYGMRRGYGPSRETFLRTLHRAAAAHGYAGTLVWQVNSAPVVDVDYNFDYQDDGGRAMRQQYAAMRAKNREA